jgi:HlyD family secretion protein
MKKLPSLKIPRLKLSSLKLPSLKLPSIKVVERTFRAGLDKVVTPLEKISIFKNLDVPGSRKSIRLHLIVGLAVVTLLTCGIGGWASTAQISGALIAPGSIVVDSNVKKVQHPTGGVVGEVRARDGDRVKIGDILVRLDDTVTKASLAIVTKQLNGLWARSARLTAEQEGADHITFPPQIMEAMADPDVKSLVANEIKLFDVRSSGRAGQKAQLRERIAQLKEEIGGLEAQETAKTREIELIQKELVGVRELFAKNLVQISRLTVLERDATRLDGDRAQFIAQKAQAKGKIAETELQIIQIDKDLSSEVSKDMREINDKIGEYVERKVTAEDQLRRIDIRAPQDGMVLQSTVHTVGGVITAGDAIMLIVPDTDNLSVEAKVNPQDIDQLRIGQNTLLRMSAFNQRTTPELNGTISRISPDTTVDQRTGQSYYTIRVSIPPAEVAKLGEVKLIPGMPVEAFVQTGDRTMLSYLAKPLSDQLMRAFREK